ncbi:EAL domain-containing protein [Ruminococcaceae bacterium OttesenSCG-928-D13]|nr:EAL domain-containing protein [Ruminococcaceae bacterium OttesenSCG-928-D13]
MKEKRSFLDIVEEIQFIRAIRRGLIMTIPLLMIGSFALVLNIMPIGFYQDFLATPVGLVFSNIFATVNEVSFGVLSLAITISVSASYARIRHSDTAVVIGAVFSSLCAYVIFIGLFTEDFNLASFGAQGMFTALFSAVCGSALYCFLTERKWFSFRLYTVGSDVDFNNIMSVILPVLVVVLAAYGINRAIIGLFQVAGFEALFHRNLNALFEAIPNSSLKSLLFIMLTNLLWFFGIHGSNVLDSVAKTIFADTGPTAVAYFLNKSVIDTFVFMGGCGTTVSLLVAILLFSKKKNTRSLAKLAAFPMWFNINEMVVFGLPIVFNASFFIPFLLVPLVCVGITALALLSGLVPPPVNSVEWVVPLFINGYQATGSIMGSLLQAFNIMVGALVYRFFLLRYEKRANDRMVVNMERLIARMHRAEAAGELLVLLEMKGPEGGFAKMLAADLEHVLKEPDGLLLYYQPQYNERGECVGAEALLRWDHPLCGMVYPPLVVGIAGETGKLGELERQVFTLACRDITRMLEAGVCPGKVSVNATAATLQDPGFVEFLQGLLLDWPEVKGRLCIELTEQMSFILGESVENRLEAIHNMGFTFAVDDFSMGHTSVKYLQSNLFDIVKLDGSLVNNMLSNARSEEIISSIIHMSKTMDFKVLAEFVETAEQRDRLMELGCYLYQGWLYSPAVPLQDFIDRMKKENGTGPRQLKGTTH